MDIIKNNSYRIIGILVGTSTKEEHSKTQKLKMYIEAGQDVQEDFSFPIIGHLNRDIYNLDVAISNLNLNNDRINAALFWFYNGNAITDQPAFDALKGSDIDQAINIWTKLTSLAEVTKSNASAYSNLATLYLSGVLNLINNTFDNNEHRFTPEQMALAKSYLQSYYNEMLRKMFKKDITFEKLYEQMLHYSTHKKDVELLFPAMAIVWREMGNKFTSVQQANLYNKYYGKDLGNDAYLEKGISLKLKFLESDFIKDFKSLATDETYKTSKKELQLIFLNQIQTEIEKNGGITSNKFLEILSKQRFSAKEDFLKDFAQKPIKQIEKQIEETKAKRKENPSKAYDLGLSLFENEKLNTIQKILNENNLQYTSIADKFSDEILQCGIVYFKKYRDTDTDPSAKAMDLFKKAKKLAVGSIAIQRCQENTENLQEWIDNKPKRDNEKRITTDLKALTAIISNFRNKNETIADVEQLVTASKPILERIKTILGGKDDLYLKLSTNVAAMAQSKVITLVNAVHKNMEYLMISDLKRVLELSLEVTNQIGNLDMEYDYKANSYNPNRDTLKSLCDQLKLRNRVKSNLNFDVDDVKMKTSIIGVVLGVILGVIGALSLTNDSFKVFYITVLFGIIGLIIGQPIGFIVFHIISGISMLVNPQKRQSFATSFINFIDDWARFVFYGLAILIVLLLFIYLIWGFEGIQTLLGIVGILLMFGFLHKYWPKKERWR
jgi:hypothetical protein